MDMRKLRHRRLWHAHDYMLVDEVIGELIPCSLVITAPLSEGITGVHVPERAGTQITDTRNCCFLRWHERTIEIPHDSRS